jgi:ABC-type multidrug transport system ATPase subunit
MWQVQRPKGQTVLAIAHRLSSLQGADQLIFVGKDGKIAETGTWKELLRIPNGKFAEYVKVQKLGKGGNEGNGEGEGGEEEGGGGKKKKKKTGK